MKQFTAEEMKTRLMFAQKILLASRAIRNLPPLDEVRLQEATEAWEAAFSRVPTKQMPELYRIGLAHKCTTAAEFQNVWDMKVEAEAAAEKHRQFLAKRAEDESKAQPIPPHILAKWNGQSAAKAR